MSSGSAACAAWLCGWLAIFCELRFARLIAGAVAGCAAVAGSAYYLLSHSPEPVSALLAVSAAALFVVEALWPARLAAAAGGTAALLGWFCACAARPPGIPLALVFLAAVAPGCALGVLAHHGRAARLWKRTGL